MRPPNYSNRAAKALSTMDSVVKKRIKKGIEEIPKGNIKPLQGFSDGRKRLRIGKYRIVFIQDGEDLDILDIASRGDIYK